MPEPPPQVTPCWPITRCPRCRRAVGAQPQLDGHWTLVCLDGCGAEWADWNGRPGHKWHPTAAMRQVLAARGLAAPTPLRPGAPPLPTGDAGRRAGA